MAELAERLNKGMGQQELQTLLRYLRALAEENRLKILGLLTEQEYSVRELADLLNLREPTVSHHLARLAELDLVRMRREGTTHFYSLNSEMLQHLGRDFLAPEKVASFVDDLEGDAWERKVMRTFFQGDRLVKIPESQKKRLVVLKWLAAQFEPGVKYSDREVNAVLTRYHPDYATLRRELVSNALLQREKGVYWRVDGESNDHS